MSLIDPTLASLLVCPVDHGDLAEDAGSVLVCVECERRYPVHDGVPVMLVDEAEGGPDD